MNIRRGDIYYANLTPVVGSEQGGVRPVVIVQNNIGNQWSPTVIVAAITSRSGKRMLPTHIRLNCRFLRKDSIALLEQVRTIDRIRLRKYIGHIDDGVMKEIDRAIAVSFGLNNILA